MNKSEKGRFETKREKDLQHSAVQVEKRQDLEATNSERSSLMGEIESKQTRNAFYSKESKIIC